MTQARGSPGARCIVLLCLLVACPSVAPAPGMETGAVGTPPRVLVIYSGDRLLPANVLFDESLRQTLTAGAGPPVEWCGEYLDEARFPAHHEERMRDMLRAKYGGHSVDVVVAFASPSLDFCLRNRSQLFPGIPIVFTGLGSDTAGRGNLEPGVTGVRSSFDESATLRLALRLHPRTRQVFVIIDPDRLDLDSTGTGRARLSEAGLRLPISHLAAQPLSELLGELSRLPANSLVVDLSGLGSSADGVTPARETMRRMSEVSTAPIYSVFDPLVGSGLVGAVTTPMDSIGRATATLVAQVLSRRTGAALPAVQSLAAVPLVDLRQLRRWGVRKGQLPPGCIVRFEPLSFWRQYRLLVVTTSALILLQSGLILALVLQSRRRHRAEIEARRRREELAHMTRVTTMGELAASLAHEINQPLAAILSNTQAAQRMLDAGAVSLEEIREILVDIAADDQRAGEVIRRMRALLRKGESSPVAIDVNELVDEVVGLVRGEIILQNVSLTLDLAPGRLPVHGDRVQLQQVLLNLMMNALDAMKELSVGNRLVLVRTARNPRERSVQVSVQDTGVGVPPESLEQIFEPFHTTKPHGLGLGLAICRSIIQSHGGRIGSSNNTDRGATFWFTLPALEGEKR